jgi:VanZ family protein
VRLRGWIRWLPPIVWAGIIFFLSAQESLASPVPGVLGLILRKGAHFVEYAVLAGLTAQAIAAGQPWGHRVRIIALVLAVLYAGSDEIHQAFVSGRHPAGLDVLIDAAGAGFGVSAFRIRALRLRA